MGESLVYALKMALAAAAFIAFMAAIISIVSLVTTFTSSTAFGEIMALISVNLPTRSPRTKARCRIAGKVRGST